MEITIQAIKEAQQKTGIKPTNGTWFYFTEDVDVNIPYSQRKVDCACALSMLYIANNSEEQFLKAYEGKEVDRPMSMVRYLALKMDIPYEFAYGFMNGFDGVDQRYEVGTSKWEGFQLGQQAWRELNNIESTREPEGMDVQTI